MKLHLVRSGYDDEFQLLAEKKGIRKLTTLIDARFRKLCLVSDDEKGYPRSVISRFTTPIGAEKLRCIIDKVVSLLKRNRAQEVNVVLDACLID